MRHIYEAPDGTMFTSEAECLEHEAKRLAYRAFDKDGELTYDLSEARVVYIYPNGADKLEDDLDKADLPKSGFTFNSTGWHFLREDDVTYEEWVPLSEGLIKRLAQGAS